MKLVQFASYDEYVSVQTARNKDILHQTPWVTRQSTDQVVRYVRNHIPQPRLGICHGVRNGWEVAEFRKALGIEVIGTEISETAGLFENVIQWDFHDVKPEWRGQVDFIYSNALDHSYDPVMCLERWMSCLSPGGCCFIEWSTNHNETYGLQSDCYSASKEEYQQLLSARYDVVDVLTVKRSSRILWKNLFRSGQPLVRRKERVLFVARNRRGG